MTSIHKAIERILAFFEKKEYAAAEKAVDELNTAYPDFHRGQFLKAVILDETGRAAEAEPYYAKAGSKLTLWLRLALQLHESDPERALIYYKRVSEMDPRNNLIWYSMGSLYEAGGRTSEARDCFRQLDPVREGLSKIAIPLGFLIIMVSGSIAMIHRGDNTLAFFLIVSAGMCLMLLKRDGVNAARMWGKKRQYKG